MTEARALPKTYLFYEIEGAIYSMWPMLKKIKSEYDLIQIDLT